MNKQQIIELIKRIAIEYGIDPDRAVQVAVKESSLNPDCVHKNKDRRKTTDRGLYQINDFWHAEVPDKCCFDAECATRFFCKMAKAGRATEWYGAENIFWVYNEEKQKVLI